MSATDDRVDLLDGGPGSTDAAETDAAGAERALPSAAWVLLVGGLAGAGAALALLLDKLALLADPTYVPSCSVDAVLSCGSIMRSPQAEVFGFPNPIIGLAAFPVVAAIGALALSRTPLPGWCWATLQLGVVAAVAFVAWLIVQSVAVIGSLCPWCMLVWAVTIPLFLAVTLHNVRTGSVPVPARARRIIGAAYPWVPFITLLCYIGIAVIAQVQLDVLRRL